MRPMTDTTEERRIAAFARSLARSPLQVNAMHEADAELVELRDGTGRLLAVKTDAVAEEIAAGLYADPELIGWMAVTSSLSDLAAVGADPLGLVISLTVPPSVGDGFLASLGAGAAAACEAAHTFVLGGDMNEGAELVVTASAVGLVPPGAAMTRRGARPGDRLYLTGPAGSGSLFALARIERSPLPAYRPAARLEAGRILRGCASSCIDTSDGVLHALDTLARVNGGRRFVLDGWEDGLDGRAREAARARRLPSWLMLAGVHGEFELLFSVSPDREARTIGALREEGLAPVRLGEVRAGDGVALCRGRAEVALDTSSLRHAAALAGRDPRGYVEALAAIARATEQEAS